MKKIISITTIIILCFTLCITTYADTRAIPTPGTSITSYNTFVTSFTQVDGNDTVNITPIYENMVSNAYLSMGGNGTDVNYWFEGKTGTIENTNYPKNGIYSLRVFPYGEYGFNTMFIPKDTPVSFTFNIGLSEFTPGIYQPNYNVRAGFRYYNANGDLLAENQTSAVTAIQGTNTTVTMSLTNNQGLEVSYIVPYIFIYPIQNPDIMLIRFDIRNINLQFTIPTEVRELEQLFLTNDFLRNLLNSSAETNDWLERILNAIEGGSGGGEADDKRDEADELIDGMDSMEKPSAGDAADSADPFDIVTESQFESFTDVLQSILNQEIIRNMLLLAIIVVLISYVLFGKK